MRALIALVSFFTIILAGAWFNSESNDISIGLNKPCDYVFSTTGYQRPYNAEFPESPLERDEKDTKETKELDEKDTDSELHSRFFCVWLSIIHCNSLYWIGFKDYYYCTAASCHRKYYLLFHSWRDFLIS